MNDVTLTGRLVTDVALQSITEGSRVAPSILAADSGGSFDPASIPSGWWPQAVASCQRT